MSARLLSAMALAVCVGAVVRGDAQQPEPSFRVSSELVVIDLVAVDRQGRFVTDLRPEDIEVKEDGRRQPVQLLRLVGAATPPSPATLPSSRPAEADAATLAPPTAELDATSPNSRRLVIVVDTLSLGVDAVPRVREALLTTLDEVPDGLPVMVATIGPDLQVTQPFTTDRLALRRAAAGLPSQLDAPAGVGRVFDAIDRLCAAAVDQRRVVEAAIEAGEQLIADAQARSESTSDALAVLADRLGTSNGRKHVVFYSSGHAISPVNQAVDAVASAVSACTGLDAMTVRREASSALGRLTSQAAPQGLRRAIDRANRAQISFYTVDPSGVTTSAVMPSTRGTAQTGGGGPMIALPGLRGDAGRDYVEGLARETGGLTLETNDLAAVLRRAWADAGQYYLVGYSPPGRGKDGVRKISVSVKRNGVSVRYRKGYIAAPAPPTPALPDTARATDGARAQPERPAPCCTRPSDSNQNDAPSRDATLLLARASTYIDDFVGRFSNVVMEETLEQTYTAAPSTLGGRNTRILTPGTTTRRQLRSEFLLVRLPSTVFWLAFRDVVEVDGRALVDRQRRLEHLFLQGSRSGLAEAQRIAADGARFFLNPRTRTTTSPVFALAFLQAHHQPRFRYRLEAPRARESFALRTLVAEEVQAPTLLRTDAGGNLPLRGRYDVDPATGSVHLSEVSVKTMGESLVLRTRFAFDERTQTMVPTEMIEEHLMRSGARMLTVARYGQVRAFSVSTTEAVP